MVLPDAPADNSDWTGRVVADSYRVLSCIGSGASADVYRAEALRDHEELTQGTRVALKVSKPHVLTKQRDAARFLREVQAVRRIDHRGCVAIYDWGISNDRAYIAMELLEGEDLHATIRSEGRFSVTRSVAIAIELCSVLIAAHQDGVVHRDLKPRNIVLLPNGEGGVLEPQLKVLDFGLAKLFDHENDEEVTVPDTLTKPGSVLGTPHYMAPEQVTSDTEIDGRADLYAASVILYEMLTGSRPYRAKNAVKLLILRSSSEPDPLTDHRPDLDPALGAIVMRGLERNPDDRYASVVEFRDALADIFPQVAEEEADMSDATIPPLSLSSVPPDGDSQPERQPLAVSSFPPDTIEDPPEDDEPTRLRKLPADVEEPPHDEEPPKRAMAPPRAELASSPPENLPTRLDRDNVYYAITLAALAAIVARILGWW